MKMGRELGDTPKPPAGRPGPPSPYLSRPLSSPGEQPYDQENQRDQHDRGYDERRPVPEPQLELGPGVGVLDEVNQPEFIPLPELGLQFQCRLEQ